MIDIKRAVSNGRLVRFQYVRDSALWFATEAGELFPVPFAEATAEIRRDEKAIMLMRWMRKYNEDEAKGPVTHSIGMAGGGE